MGTIPPYYRPLSPEGLKLIDETARRILSDVGIRILDGGFLEALEAAGARVSQEDSMARFGGGWLDEKLKLAPTRFTLYSRDGQNDLDMGGGRVHFANGGRVFRILDMNTGGYRLTMLRDIENTATLVDNLDNIRLYIIACQAHDLEPEHYHLNDFFCAFNHTTKHVMGGCDDIEGARQMYALACHIAGGEDRLRERPFASVITNPVSPLTLESNTLRILKFAGECGIPATCAPAPIAGATAPATLAGTLAQMHAEALAGVSIAQTLNPGSKVLYGAVPTSMDLRNMEYTMGSVEMGMMNAAAVQLAKLYNLPIYASGGVTEAKRPDIQAGVEKNFSALTTAMTGADLVHLAAGMLDSASSISYEQYVIDNEIIGMIHRILRGIEVSPETLGYEVIGKVGPGGHYFLEDHTVEHMMTEFFYPSLGVRSNFDIWEESGRPSMLTRAQTMVDDILEEGRDGLLDQPVISEIKEAFPGIKNT